jgi:transcriptional regulator of acetoin/glycerol metabolism
VTEPAGKTLSVRAGARERPARTVSALYIALEGARPWTPSARIVLDGAEALRLGRGARREVRRGDREVDVAIADPRMSSTHAEIVRELGGWVIRDLGSKNGTRVDGAPIDTARLADGAVIEMGHAMCVYRRHRAPAIADLEGGDPALPIGLRTVCWELEEQFRRLARVAASRSPVIIGGESGTGKELAARAIHELSGRAGPFVAINCGAIPDSLVEAELFGARRGAYSGADRSRTGRVAAADGGTLFLDEIGDLPPPSQAALLRVLQEGEVVPLGATEPERVDLRIASATLRDLEALVEAGEFRGDLLARLSGFGLRLPPLRERREDLGSLCGALLHREHGARAERLQLSLEATRALIGHRWPMNIRELEKALVTATALAPGDVIELEHLPEAIRDAPPDAGPELDAADAARREQLVALLGEHRGNVSAVARATGKGRTQIQRWIKRYGIDVDRLRR